MSPWWSAVLGSAPATSTPVFQMAADGRWEDAHTVPIAGPSAGLGACIEQVAEAAQRDVAVEVFWPAEVFVGVRWRLPQFAEALSGVQRARSVLSGLVPRPAEAARRALLGGAPRHRAGFAELGAVNAWASTGPLVLWRRGQTLTSAALDEALASRPDLARCAHPLAVELAATEPRPCWVGVTVSTRSGAFHRLDRAALDAVLERGAAGTPSAPVED